MYTIKSYPETSYQYNSGRLDINLPWLSGQLPVARKNFMQEGPVKQGIVDGLLNSGRIDFPNDELPLLPFCQTMARCMEDFQHFTRREIIKQEVEFHESVSAFLSSTGIDTGTLINDEYWSESWLWNAEQLFESTGIKQSDYYDPVSIYTAIRRLRNLDQLTKKHALALSKNLNHLLTHDEPLFFDQVLKLLFQSYFITSHCVDSLLPSLELSEFATDRMQSYIAEENGHHKLVLRSIHVLNKGQAIGNNEFPETIILMKVLKYCAAHHPTALCCLIGAFEQTAQFASDPLADLLLCSSMPDAAKGISKHFDINKSGGHDEVGLQLAAELNPVSSTEALMAIRFSELFVLLLEGIAFRINQQR